MKVTINKVAELAGVSRGAVDRVIHGRPGVSRETIEKVNRVIEETGFVPIHVRKAVPEDQIKTVAVIIPRPSNPFFEKMADGMKRFADPLYDKGFRAEYYFCDDTEIDTFLAILKQIGRRRIDACVVRGTSGSRFEAWLNSIRKKGMPIFYVDSAPPHVSGLCLVGEDGYQSGRIIASLAAKLTGRAGTVALISGSPDIETHELRLKGFREAAAMFPGMVLTGPYYTHEDSKCIYETVQNVLQSHPSVDYLVNLAGGTGAAGRAIRESGRAGKTGILCYNLTQDVTELIREGMVQFTISLNPDLMGERVMQIVYAYLMNGTEPESSFIRIPVSIVMDENMI